MSSRPGGKRPLEVWAGFESTVNRVGDEYIDQSSLNGHDRRIEDLDLLVDLGVSAVRYPVLWERTAPDGVERADWSWPDERLSRLRELGVRPIVGLVHHGSGPRSTSLLDPEFAEKLAAYARAVAERYGWVEDWTPVNEPLTTARFSALYGHWYPHARDDPSFYRALVNQCRAVVLAMRAIREVVPAARLVQTDDLGKVFSTPVLAYQAQLENERRWVSYDLLTGRLERDGLMWRAMRERGIGEDDLLWFEENAEPPDIVGINHYLSSERFLDERLDRYPPDSHGGNGRHAYADVLAARVCEEGPFGPGPLFLEAWERYRRPVALTEAHNGCTREEQLRWLRDVWEGAEAAREHGADIRAVTVWSLLGAIGWDTLVTAPGGRYEPGVYDLRGPRPRPTALASYVRALATGEQYDHPALAGPGWWRRPDRLHFPPVSRSIEGPLDGRGDGSSGEAQRPIVVTGARGTLGRAVARACEARGLAYRLLTRQELDIAEPGSVAAALDEVRPWAVVNAAGFVRVDEAEISRDACFRENAVGVGTLAAACAARGIRLATFSSDLVFDGAKETPYVETDDVAPLNVYGLSKAEGEERALDALDEALVVRTSAFFGADDWNFVTLALRALAAGEPFAAADDTVVSPTYVPDLVELTLDLLIDGERGIWHLANRGETTWAELARAAAREARVRSESLDARPMASLGVTAPRPAYSALGSERGVLLPPLDDALSRYVRERAA